MTADNQFDRVRQVMKENGIEWPLPLTGGALTPEGKAELVLTVDGHMVVVNHEHLSHPRLKEKIVELETINQVQAQAHTNDIEELTNSRETWRAFALVALGIIIAAVTVQAGAAAGWW